MILRMVLRAEEHSSKTKAYTRVWAADHCERINSTNDTEQLGIHKKVVLNEQIK